MTDASTPGPVERIGHLLALVSVGSLFAIYGLIRLFGDADASPVTQVGLLAVQTLPLLVFVPPLLQGSARAAAALAFVSMIYFLAGVLAVVDPDARFAGIAEVFFSISLFFSATLFARARGQRLQAEDLRAGETGTD